MIAYFPTPYPDELVYSLFCRYYVHSGCLTHKMALQELYCKRSDNPSKEFLGNLRPEAKKLLEIQYGVDKLIINHTMYPQYARFIPLEQKKTALYRLWHDPCDVHHLFSVLPRNEGEQHLCYCPLCVKENRMKYGETYWHRKHQNRNMNVCPRHQCRLMESSVPVKSEQSYTFYPAEFYTQDAIVVREDNVLLVQFAKYLEAVFDAPMDFHNDVPVSAILYDGMSRTKYLKPSGRSRYTQLLAEDIRRFYGELGISNMAGMNQIQRVLLGSRFDFPVVCQLAFFLGMELKELMVPSLTAEQIQKEMDSHYMKGAAPVDWGKLDDETAPILERFARSVYEGTASANGRPERVSERMVYRELGLLGHQLENMPKCRAIFERYTESYPESWARKLVWAYRKLEGKGVPFYWSDLRELSGVKKKNVAAAMPYLRKYLGDQIEDIVALTATSCT